MKKYLLILLALVSFSAYAQKGKAKRSAVTSATSTPGVPCQGFTWTIIGDNHVKFPYDCTDSVVFEMTCALPNEWYCMKFPANQVILSTGTKLAEGGLYFKTNENGYAKFIFNGEGCADERGVVYKSPVGWFVPAGAYAIEVRWGWTLQWWTSDVPLIIEN